MTRIPLRWSLVLALAALLVIVGCTDDDDGEESRASAAKPKAVAGAPVRLGFINQEDVSTGAFPQIREGAVAAVKYLNAERGGIGGRPLELVPCPTNGTPTSSAACAGQLAGQKVVAVQGGIDFGSAASLPVLAQAGIPYAGYVPVLPPDLTSPNSFAFVSGSVGEFSAQAVYIARTLKAQRVAVLYTDSPAGVQAARTYVEAPLAKLGVTDVTLVAEKAGTRDFRPALEKAAQGDRDAVVVLFVEPGCSRVMRAAQEIRLTAKLFFPASCADPQILASAGGAADDAYFTPALLNAEAHAGEAQVEELVRALDRYGGTSGPVPVLAAQGFSSTMNIAAAMNRVGVGSLSPQTLSATLAGARNQGNFLGHPYSCDGARVPGAPSVCNNHVRVLQRRSGKLVDVAGEWIDGSEALR